MADEHVPTREVVGAPPVDPLIAFFWARLDEREAKAKAVEKRHWRADEQLDAVEEETDHYLPGTIADGVLYGDMHERLAPGVAAHIADNDPAAALADVAAKKAILDDYARYCADLNNPGRELICQVTRDVIKRLATVYDGHPDYDEAWRP